MSYSVWAVVTVEFWFGSTWVRRRREPVGEKMKEHRNDGDL